MLEKSAVVRGLEMMTTPGGTGDNKSSLCLDILAQRQSEVEFIYGKPLELAEEAGLRKQMSQLVWLGEGHRNTFTQRIDAMTKRFDGKTAFVSGGSRGIGLAIATRLATEGADVMISGSQQKNLDAALAAITEKIRQAVLAHASDLRQMAGCEAAFTAHDAALAKDIWCIVPAQQKVGCFLISLMPIFRMALP